jgi:hypothetical protein
MTPPTASPPPPTAGPKTSLPTPPSPLESCGTGVIQFTNTEEEGDLDTVLARIREAPRLPFE